MLAYIARRLMLLPVILFGVTVLIFAMLQFLSPYQRVALFVSDVSELKQGKEQLDRLIEKYGLDDPIPKQYLRWLSEVLRGNLGASETARMPVAKALVTFLPATAELALYSVLPILIVGVWLGVLSAKHYNKPLDHLTRFMSITGWSFPTFVFGLVVLMLLYDWFPAGRLSQWAGAIVNDPGQFIRYTGLNTLDALLNWRFDVLADALRHLVLPVLTLSYLSWALLVRVTRSSMLETLRQDYITTARAKGLSERAVINKHAVRNALLPVVTLSGFLIYGLLTGVVITETIFNYPGLGKFAADAVIAAGTPDVPAVLGFAMFTTLLIVAVNLVVDVLYAYIDPRVRLG